jgi:hypothetical protein
MSLLSPKDPPLSGRKHGEAWGAFCRITTAGQRTESAWVMFLAGWISKADQKLAQSRYRPPR